LQAVNETTPTPAGALLAGDVVDTLVHLLDGACRAGRME
jgi:hypothetical protein